MSDAHLQKKEKDDSVSSYLIDGLIPGHIRATKYCKETKYRIHVMYSIDTAFDYEYIAHMVLFSDYRIMEKNSDFS